MKKSRTAYVGRMATRLGLPNSTSFTLALTDPRARKARSISIRGSAFRTALSQAFRRGALARLPAPAVVVLTRDRLAIAGDPTLAVIVVAAILTRLVAVP